ncbi:hypothetical protein [Noviherbaspirillum sp.]|uniref:hypothetical protein n=1 Tax=Noviherbaspirillum sp. TaxID=1926288 RepID=UPI002FE230BA
MKPIAKMLIETVNSERGRRVEATAAMLGIELGVKTIETLNAQTGWANIAAQFDTRETVELHADVLSKHEPPAAKAHVSPSRGAPSNVRLFRKGSSS